ncbi:MAG: RtcB family protein, partial [Bacteroidota bacterium]
MTGKELIALGFPQGPAIGEVLKITRNLAKTELETLQPTLTNILSQPLQFEQDNIWAPVAKALIGPPKDPAQQDLLPEAKAYEVYGPEGIEAAALRQIDTAMRLPITRAGALMADAHYGYGLPIGGV